jgi:hypothetical protein
MLLSRLVANTCKNSGPTRSSALGAPPTDADSAEPDSVGGGTPQRNLR